MKIEEAFQSVNRLFLDSAPVIYYVEINPGYSAIMDRIFDWIKLAPIRVVTSPVTLAECLILPLRERNLSQQQLFTDMITGQDTADFVSITSEIARTAADIRARDRLQLPDALQIATALDADCQAFLTLRRTEEPYRFSST